MVDLPRGTSFLRIRLLFLNLSTDRVAVSTPQEEEGGGPGASTLFNAIGASDRP
jgi:hypothetical protein